VKQKPTVGRIVHYVEPQSAPGRVEAGPSRPAIIVEVHDDETCGIKVFLPGGGSLYEPKAKFAAAELEADRKPFTWHWPPRA
jgi:hypothetical protein